MKNPNRVKTKKVTIIKNQDLTWYDLEKPQKEEYDMLRRKFQFHPLDIQDCISPVQRPKIDEYDDYIFLIIRLPYYKEKEKVIMASELDIFIGKDYLVTIHRGKVSTLKSFVEECKSYQKIREKYLQYGPGFLLYEILKRMFDRCYPLLDSIGEEIDRMENKMFRGHERETVKTIANIKRNVINFRKIMKAHRQVIKKIMESDKFFLNLNGARLHHQAITFKYVLEEIENIWDILDGHAETIFALDRTNESLISHQLNKVMKALTIISAIFLPAALITQFFGISFGDAPFTQNTIGILAILFAIILTSALMILFFRRKKWL